mmetsp:Transcript_7800/g.21753  ORF Transcript_7800/g.21753 Transcript_7800/m.21753 type:complete len:89 (-) Transcript_7800:18-284(-)
MIVVGLVCDHIAQAEDHHDHYLRQEEAGGVKGKPDAWARPQIQRSGCRRHQGRNVAVHTPRPISPAKIAFAHKSLKEITNVGHRDTHR